MISSHNFRHSKILRQLSSSTPSWMTESSNTIDIDVSERSSSNSANSYIFNFLNNILLPITGVFGVLTILLLFTNYGDDLLDNVLWTDLTNHKFT
ncbi:hypothetical protein C9374_003000 [Naegleria lovaniensis]|uniref:Uncharacterized protein n=1 Tax=Naegleria lovaniensis TaxID=51637 RepID=A0AA88GU46_NAELO|nr:uncharacterized protein C9374_003000 [Naegleria lovaniensis]KAG2385851.1 hypothetical protein C9374_003000 [Naegleria lovaniensis]